MRAEGRMTDDEFKKDNLSALVLSVDTEQNITAKGSEVLLSARQRCTSLSCQTQIRIDHKAIAQVLPCSQNTEAQSTTRGAIVGKISDVDTDVTIDGLTLGNSRFSLFFEKISYKRIRGTEISAVKANGSFTIMQETPRIFSIDGNLRDPNTLKIK